MVPIAAQARQGRWNIGLPAHHPPVTGAIPTRAALLLLGAVLLALTLTALALHIPGALSVGSPGRRNLFVALLAAAAATYLLAIRLVRHRPAPAGSVLIVVAVALAMRLPVVLAPPFLSTDINRYIWDGRVQVAGINPYRYLPADPALQSLRDPSFPLISRATTARTIYPPVAQIVFQTVARISPTITAMKLTMVGFEALACWAMLRLLDLARLPRARVLTYAWNPLAVWAFAGNGHVDAVAVGLLAVALLLRATRRDTWVGVALGAAVLVKFLPAAVAPALWRRGAALRMPLVALATIIGMYLIYIDAGWHVLGFLPGYFGDEDLTEGTGIWLLAGLGLLIPVTRAIAEVYAAAALAGLATLAAWIAFRPRPPEAAVHPAGEFRTDPREITGPVRLSRADHAAPVARTTSAPASLVREINAPAPEVCDYDEPAFEMQRIQDPASNERRIHEPALDMRRIGEPASEMRSNNEPNFDLRRTCEPALEVRRICGDAALLAAAVTVVISPHYPWYFVWLALPCCVCARWSIIWLSVAPVLLYLDPWHERFLWPCLVYLPAAAFAVHAWWRPAVSRSLDGIEATQGSS